MPTLRTMLALALASGAPMALAQATVGNDAYAPDAPMLQQQQQQPALKPPVFQGKPPVFVPPPGSAWQPAPAPSQPLFGRSLPKPAPDPFNAPKLAMQPRAFPGDTMVGAMTPGIFPEVSIDGQPMRFTASATIRNQSNMVAMPATLMGSTWPVRYTLDQAGQVKSVWILTDTELEAERRR